MKINPSKYINILRLIRNERRSLDELIHRQNIALRKLIKHSYGTVKFYKRLFDDCGLRPEDIKSAGDITKIPVIDKKMLQKNPIVDLISSRFNKKNLKRITTSGSSGMPLEFYIDSSYDQYRKAQFMRPYISNGQRLSDRSISFSYYEAPEKKWFHHLGLLSDHRIISGWDLSAQIKAIQNIKPAVIKGYGSVLNLLANKIIDEKIWIPNPRLLFTDSEVLTTDERENIGNAFGAPVIDIYGTWETGNIAYECSCRSGYHIAIDSVIMEFLKEGKPVSRDDEGEITVTVLDNYSMPFIRYNLNDIASYSEQKCACGRTFPLFNQIKGRKNDYMISEDGKKISYFTSYFNRLAPHVYEYQIIQEDINLFKVLIVPGKSYRSEGENIFIPVIKRFFPNAEIDIKLVEAIERAPSGKFAAFKSMVKDH
ncbi:MAG: phenylacetate--CoA ligase family protein [Ignavibacteria bacterium]